MFVPLVHPPGHAQVDFGEAVAVIGGVERYTAAEVAQLSGVELDFLYCTDPDGVRIELMRLPG